MKRKLFIFILSVININRITKRPEEDKDWNDLLGYLTLFLYVEIGIMPYIIPSLLFPNIMGDRSLVLKIWGLFTCLDLAICSLLSIVGVIIILSKKRKALG
jgi:hypothetical protein